MKYLLKNYKGALDDYNKAIIIDPTDSDVYVSLGNIKYEMNDKAGACIDWNKASELGNTEAKIFITEHCK